jgi:hypothetical protein
VRGVRFAARDYEEEDTCLVCATVWCVFRGRTVGSENRGGVVLDRCLRVCATVWCVFRGRTVGSENRGGVVLDRYLRLCATVWCVFRGERL